ncbi:MAG: class I SAM-dependent methyltransferase [Cephaloticoccus sp.]|nr:class I SAM-dependent methyltransferase [Cephaloticoccus sp.]MCF7760963.1 class I SAM-dependent methyltransferase [Cephaloticoccus sp.]
MDVPPHNRQAWNEHARNGNPWSIPVSPEEIARARSGDWQVILTPNKPVPREWFGEITGQDVLGLASGGGQQVPLFAAAGARVTSFDNSDEQLALDKLVADREGLEVRILQGDMANLSLFADASFDLIFHPVANVFVPDVLPVWRECARVLRPGGRLLAGFMNPAFFWFDHDEAEKTGKLEVKYRLPYSDLTSLPPARLAAHLAGISILEFGHSLDDQIGGQIKAGLVVTGFFEDDWSDEATPLNRYGPMYIATLSQRLPMAG